MKTHYSEEQIIKILEEAEAGRALEKIVRKYGIAEAGIPIRGREFAPSHGYFASSPSKSPE